LQMKATSNAGAPAKSDNDTVLASVSGNRKSGASVPSGVMVEGVRGIGISLVLAGGSHPVEVARPGVRH